MRIRQAWAIPIAAPRPRSFRNSSAFLLRDRALMPASGASDESRFWGFPRSPEMGCPWPSEFLDAFQQIVKISLAINSYLRRK